MTRLKFARLDTDPPLSQSALALLSGLSQPLISLIETRRQNPTPSELDALARVLGISPPSALLQEVVDREFSMALTEQRP